MSAWVPQRFSAAILDGLSIGFSRRGALENFQSNHTPHYCFISVC